MSINKLSGDKLAKRQLANLYQGYLDLEGKIVDLVEETTADKELRVKIYRQLTSIASIIRKEALK